MESGGQAWSVRERIPGQTAVHSWQVMQSRARLAGRPWPSRSDGLISVGHRRSQNSQVVHRPSGAGPTFQKER